MISGSCHFLCHQFTQRDEPDQIIADMDALAAFSAAFIRSPDIDRLYQLMGRVRRQFRQHTRKSMRIFVRNRYRIRNWRAVSRSGSEPLSPNLACWDNPKPL